MKTFLLLNLILLGFLMNLNATVHTVTLSGDHAESPQEGMLRYYINQAAKGDTIVFDVDHITLVASLRISYKGLTLLGGKGVVLDGNHADRVLNVSYDSFNKVVLKNLTIQNGFLQDESMAMGGGMYAFGTGGNENLLVENCTFRNNEVACNGDGQGGALRTKGGTFINCTFLDNAVTGTGYSNSGGAAMSVGGTFINCLFARNSAKFGGGLYATSGSKIINSTITQNTSGNGGNGAGLSLESASTCVNSIIYDNFTGTIHDNLDVSDATLSFCAMEQSNAMVGTNNNIGLSASPFINAASGDYRLAKGSTCIHAGNSEIAEITTYDLAGNGRINGPAIDMGAYEYYISIVISGILKREDGTPLANYALHELITTDENGAYRIEAGQNGIQRFEVLELSAAPIGHAFYPQELVVNYSQTLNIIAYQGTVVDKDYSPGSTVVWESGIVNVFTTINLNNSSLTIPKGTLVKFHGYYGIRVFGTGQLNAVGTADERITFTSADKTGFDPEKRETAGSWHRISFDKMSAEADSSRLKFCVLEYSKEISVGATGGALRVMLFDKLSVENCLFQHNGVVHNAEPNGGGAISVSNSNLNIVNCIITNNYCRFNNSGGAITVSMTIPKVVKIINCTILNNYAAGEGGGLFSRGGSNEHPAVKIYNSIFEGNGAGGFNKQVVAAYCDVYSSYIEGALTSDFNHIDRLLTTGTVFDSAEGDTYALAESSVGINAGTLDDIANLLPKTDFYGLPRVHQNRIDMGALEHQNDIHTVIRGKVTNEAGEVLSDVEIYPGISTNAAGQYQISAGTNNIKVGDILSLNNSLGFNLYPQKLVVHDLQSQEIDLIAFSHPVVDKYTPFDEPLHWNGIVNVMVDVLLNNSELQIAGGSTLRFFNHSSLTLSGTSRMVAAGLPGDTITFTAGDPGNFNLYNLDKGSAWGGIRFSQMSQQAPASTLDYCKIEYAKSTWEGGALIVDDFDKLSISNCLFQHNSGWNGGALYLKDSQVSIKNTIIRNNGTIQRSATFSGEGGAGIYVRNGQVDLIGCEVSNNRAFGFGGAINAYNCEMNIVNSNIVYNESGISTYDLKTAQIRNSTLHIYNSIIWGNKDYRGSLNLMVGTPLVTNIYNSCIEGGNTFGADLYQNCTDADPLFVDAANRNYQLQGNSPLVNAGLATIPTTYKMATDLLNNPRRMGERVDIGAYEYNETSLLINAPFEYKVGESVNVEGLVHMGEAISWSWDFNQDGIEDADEAAASYIYDATGVYIIQLTGQIVGEAQQTTVYHTIEIKETVTSLPAQVKIRFEVYPNPVGALLMLEADKAYNLSVTNLRGQKVWQGTMTGTRHSLNTSAWPTGIYFVRFYNQQESSVHKVVKK